MGLRNGRRPDHKVNIGVGKDNINDFARKYNLEIEDIYEALNQDTAKKIVFYNTSDYWSAVTGGYKLSIPHNGNIVFAVYRTDSPTESTQVLTGVSMDSTNVNVESVDKFSGYLLCATLKDETKSLLISEDGTHWDAEELPIRNIGGPQSVTDVVTKDYVDRILEGYSGYGERLAIFDTVAQMRESELIPSQMAVTLGYWDINDGGQGVYNIRAKQASDIHQETIEGQTVDVVGDNGSVIAIGDEYDAENVLYVAELITDGMVNVKQFGAKGDGTEDDTKAIQNAVNFGRKVIFPKASYKTGQIDVDRSIEIDLSLSSIVATENTFLNCTGKVVATLTGEADYIYNQVDYTITNASYSSYTGFAFLRGENNFEKSRTYYVGGFACQFDKGVMEGAYPVDVNTNVALDIITPITVTILNIGEINHVNADADDATKSIFVKYGINCIVENAEAQNASSYLFVDFDSCINCHVLNFNVKQDKTSTNNNSYIVAFTNSSLCGVEKSVLYNKKWHCVTTGGHYLCYCNTVKESKLISDDQMAYGCHENEYGTSCVNSTISTSMFGAGCFVDNVKILSANDGSSYYAHIEIAPVSDERNAVYTVKNVDFDVQKGKINTDERMSIMVKHYPQTTGNTYYVKELNLINIYGKARDNNDYCGALKMSFRNTENYVIKKAYVQNTNMNIELGKTAAQTNVDISAYRLIVSNCISNQRTYVGHGYVYQDVFLSDIRCRELAGTFSGLYMSNILTTQEISASLNVSNTLYATGVHSKITEAALLVPTNLRISDMKYTNLQPRFNITSASNGKKYWQKFDVDTLSFVTEEITSS